MAFPYCGGTDEQTYARIQTNGEQRIRFFEFLSVSRIFTIEYEFCLPQYLEYGETSNTELSVGGEFNLQYFISVIKNWSIA